jgi:hypothetical protein
MSTMSSRDIAMLVREALDERAARLAGRDPAERRPLAEVLAESIPGELIPDLKDAYLTMLAMSAQWQQKSFQAALGEAARNNTLLAGFPVTVWMSWGGLLLALLDFLDTPQEAWGGITAKDALLDDYLLMSNAEWAARNAPAPTPKPAEGEEESVPVSPGVETGNDVVALP